MKTVILISRFLLGAVFIFSGFVKGVDPLGTSYKIEDYLIAYQMDWVLPLSLLFAFGLIALEFSLGLMLIFNLLPKFTYWTMAILMGFFTFVTFYDALYNPIPDCGCFGDALILTNWQTFYKNLVLDFFIIGLFFYRPLKIKVAKHLIWSFVIFIGFLSFSFYNLQHLPLIDFRFWKIGSQIIDTNQKSIELYLTYQNKNTGEEQEFLSPHFPYQDSVWLSNWEYKSMREFNPNINAETVMFFDLEGNNATTELLLFVSHTVDAIDKEESNKIKHLLQVAEKESLPVFLITASVGKKIDNFVEQNQIDVPVFLADDIDLKTIIRSNPGLILLENGTVINKWAGADFPVEANQIFE